MNTSSINSSPRKLLTISRLTVLVLFLALFAMAVRTPADTDMWWHLAAGRAIVTAGRIPYTDQFSFTVNGRPWTDVQWLAQVGMYEARTLGGDAALVMLTAILVALALMCVYPQMEGSWFLRAIVVILAATASSVTWSPRPQMLSFALLGVTSYVVYLLKWRQVNRLWVLIPLFLLWGNVHGGYALGLMLIGSVVVGETLNRVTGRAKAPEVMTWKEVGFLAGVGVLCGLALLANPYTIGTWTLPFRTVGIKTLQEFIQEWASPDFHNLYEQPMLWLLFGLLAAVGFSGRRWDWSDLIAVVAFGYSALLARRNIAPFALVIAPVLTRQLQPVVESAAARAKLPASVRQDINPALATVLNGLILTLVILAVIAKCGVALASQMIDKAKQQTVPVRAVEWLGRSGLAGPMYNSYHWGGYLVWALPGEPVFVDGRTDIYEDEFLREYIQVTFIRPGWKEVLDRYGVRLALTERDSFLATILATQPEWRLAYGDDQAVIYVREDR